MFDMWDAASLTDFRQSLLAWFASHQRPLPWRQGYDPYHVWIAEIMGQQTQMDRVTLYFQQWIKLFPDIKTLASASEQATLKAWEGLGYYGRVHNIRRAAKQLVQNGQYSVPSNLQQLLALPGIGPYTAAAILSIAYNLPYPLLDANVARLLARLYDIDAPLKQAQVKKQLEHLTDILLDREHPRLFNQALMELGALVCTPRQARCELCPVQSHCLSFSRNTVSLRPVLLARKQRVEIAMACVILRHGDLIFIQQRLSDDIWGGLWEFPGGCLEKGESPEAAAIRELHEETGWQVKDIRFFATVVHYYTHHRVTLSAYIHDLSSPLPSPALTAATQSDWVLLRDLEKFPFPAGHRQLIIRLLDTELKKY